MENEFMSQHALKALQSLNFMQLQNFLMVIPAEENACSPETEEAMISR